MLKMVTDEDKEEDVDKMTDLIMKMADINGDKMIDYEELVKFIYDEKSNPNQKLREAFRLCDADRDGFVSKKELGEFLKLGASLHQSETEELSKDNLEQMMTVFDRDGDGKLNYQEF